jgi:hypothetical protein
MKGKELYKYICIQWQLLYKNINIDVILDENELNVFHTHDLVELSHIFWSVPVTLYQLLLNTKISKLIDCEGYQIVLFVLALLYSKYHSDDSIVYEGIWWQWRIVCNDNSVMMKYEYLHNIEKKIIKLMNYDIENYAIGSGDIYDMYYLLDSQEEKKDYIYSILEKNIISG